MRTELLSKAGRCCSVLASALHKVDEQVTSAVILWLEQSFNMWLPPPVLATCAFAIEISTSAVTPSQPPVIDCDLREHQPI